MVLSKQKCALIESALDDCKIASCKDEERKKVNSAAISNDAIPSGAICRIKCRSVKATRCRCCKAGFVIGKKCPEAGEADSCDLEVDENALYEGPRADLYPAKDWRDCYQACIDRGMNCQAASYVKLRFNSMCWVFNSVTTRYGSENEDERDTFGGPTRELFGLRSGKRKNIHTVQNKPLFDLPVEMQPEESIDVDQFSRSGTTGFRQPFASSAANDQVGIAKGDAVATGANYVGEPVMRSWYRKCLQ